MTEQPTQSRTNTREEDLAYALLWLRNHYEFDSGRDLELFHAVIERVDRVLADGPPITGAASLPQAFCWR